MSAIRSCVRLACSCSFTSFFWSLCALWVAAAASRLSSLYRVTSCSTPEPPARFLPVLRDVASVLLAHAPAPGPLEPGRAAGADAPSSGGQLLPAGVAGLWVQSFSSQEASTSAPSGASSTIGSCAQQTSNAAMHKLRETEVHVTCHDALHS